jgi:tol-pal system protein YbgF
MPARGSVRAVLGAALLAVTLGALSPARAALFDDDEARKRIESLRTRIDTLEQQINQRLERLESRDASMADMLRDVDAIKADLARLRGQYEVMTYELEQAQKRQRDLYLDLDGRLRKLEGGPGANVGTPGTDASAAAAPSASAPAGPASPGAGGASEQRDYDAALDKFKSGAYPAAISGFQGFVRNYPRSPLAPSALYWVGNAQYAQKDFRGAIGTQRQLIATYPDSNKIPDAMLNVASCQIELGDSPGARRTLEDIVSRYPGTEAAGKAKQRLAGR